MIVSLRELYKRFNQFGEYNNSFPVHHSNTMAKIYKEYSGRDIELDKIIMQIENPVSYVVQHSGSLYMGNEFIQPKSVGFRLDMLHLLLDSMPESFFLKICLDECSIMGITCSIFLFYLALHTDSFTYHKMDSSEKKYLLSTEDFSFTIRDIRNIRGSTEEKIFDEYIKCFSVDINNLDDTRACLFNDEEKCFIFSIQDFADYILFTIEDMFRSLCSKNEYDEYVIRKGELFEEYVYTKILSIYDNCYHTLYYQPNDHQKMELDIVLREAENLAVFECKSGTINMAGLFEESALKVRIMNKTKKAYLTLKAVYEYLLNNPNYTFECGNEKIEGKSNNIYLIHISMYSMDFISSNLHALIPDYYNENNPILSLSLEHLIAIILDLHKKNHNIFYYWNKRKEYIKKHPGFYYDNNELDLYYELIHEDSMLAEMEEKGLLDQMNPNCHLISTFRDQYGQELRPADEMIKNLESAMLYGIIKHGKSAFGLNKRFLKNLDSYLRI